MQNILHEPKKPKQNKAKRSGNI